jgi:hypothetical protein
MSVMDWDGSVAGWCADSGSEDDDSEDDDRSEDDESAYVAVAIDRSFEPPEPAAAAPGWGYRVRDSEAEWGEWQPASSATHAIELVQAELPEDAEAQALSRHRLYNQVGRGSSDGARKATRRPLSDHIEFRSVLHAQDKPAAAASAADSATPCTKKPHAQDKPAAAASATDSATPCTKKPHRGNTGSNTKYVEIEGEYRRP